MMRVVRIVAIASYIGECMNFTQQVLDDYLNENKERQNLMRTFLKFERSLVGEGPIKR